MYYNRHRYYDNETVQYLSPDPIGLSGEVNPYGYVANPRKWIDPLGLTAEYKPDSPFHGQKPTYTNPGRHDPLHLILEEVVVKQPICPLMLKMSIENLYLLILLRKRGLVEIAKENSIVIKVATMRLTGTVEKTLIGG